MRSTQAPQRKPVSMALKYLWPAYKPTRSGAYPRTGAAAVARTGYEDREYQHLDHEHRGEGKTGAP